MDDTVVTYLVYLALALPLTFWVASALQRYGKVFLIDVFDGDDTLADAVNRLLVIGFYLLNLGYVSLFMTSHADVHSARQLLEVLSTKIGGVALVLGVVHFANVWAFNAFRRRAVLRAKAGPPVPPSGFTPVAPSGPWAATPPSGPSPVPPAPWGGWAPPSGPAPSVPAS